MSFIDAAGLGAIVRCRQLLATRPYLLSVVNPSVRVRRVFTLGGLVSILPTS